MSKSKSGDGRRNNRPPVEHQIGPGEIRNPHGCNGKPEPLTEIEQYFLDEANRIVSRDENGEVSAAKRLVQELFAAALRDKDLKASARLLVMLPSVMAKAEKRKADFFERVLTAKAEYEEEFHIARVRGTAPPDVCHPDHVHPSTEGIVFTGPIDRRGRKLWEQLKASIKMAAWLHGRARERFRQSPTEENRLELKRLEAHRRKLMRRVPTGFNWQEDIYCRYSQTKTVETIIANWIERP